jgi:hypothetical protein
MNLRVNSERHGVLVDLTLAELEELQRAVALRTGELTDVLQRSRALGNRPQYTIETRRAAAAARMILRCVSRKLDVAELAAVRARLEREAEPVEPSAPDPFPLVPYRSSECLRGWY